MNIKILPDIIANRIAAGEVVERPASVVKELLENALDAGAGGIAIEVESGGRRLIRVADDGIGMGREDAILSIERHATSKIDDVEDINRIATLGFRGEALPSIASISRMVIETRRKEDELGSKLVINGGELRSVADSGRDVGTTVEVKNLFYNVPARRKFLRSDNTEMRHIRNAVEGAVIAMPSLSISLSSNGRMLFEYNGRASREEMLAELFGDTLAGQLLPLQGGIEDASFHGWFGKPSAARRSGIFQYTILNGRPVKVKSLARAVHEGYGSMIERGTYPPYVLYVETDPARVDVNVHPTKREVRIHREYAIVQAVRDEVAATVQTFDGVPELRRQYSRPFADEYRPYSGNLESRRTSAVESPDATVHPAGPDERGGQPLNQTAMPFGEQAAVPPKPSPSGSTAETVDYDAAPYEGPAFWQLKDRYFMTTVKEGALIFDQHVAHERILYEELLAHFSGREAPAQQLLFTMVLDFPAADYEVLEPMLPFLNQVGFGVREFGDRSVVVDAVPSWYNGPVEENIFAEYIDEMRAHGRISSGYIEKLAAAIACRSAIKAGKPLTQDEMRYLADRLFATEKPFVCPHGRPTVIKLTLDELDRRFGR